MAEINAEALENSLDEVRVLRLSCVSNKNFCNAFSGVLANAHTILWRGYTLTAKSDAIG